MHVACPHCGFQNFAISAYCGRCERPLRGGAKVDEAPEKLPDTASGPTGAVARKEPRKPPLVRPPLAAVPPPGPPPNLETPQPAPLPIELSPAAPKRAAKQARKRRKTLRRSEALAELEVALPSTRRVIAAQAIDFVAIACVGWCSALAETALLEDSVNTSGGLLDQLAMWIHSHPGPASHGLFVSLFFGLLYAVLFAKGSGRSLGRFLTDTVLVHNSGHPITWRMAVLRALFCGLALLPFGAGFFWVIVNAQRRTWQDLYAGTVVVHRKVRPGRLPAAAAKGPLSA